MLSGNPFLKKCIKNYCFFWLFFVHLYYMKISAGGCFAGRMRVVGIKPKGVE